MQRKELCELFKLSFMFIYILQMAHKKQCLSFFNSENKFTLHNNDS